MYWIDIIQISNRNRECIIKAMARTKVKLYLQCIAYIPLVTVLYGLPRNINSMGICTFENKIYIYIYIHNIQLYGNSHALNAECGHSSVYKECSCALTYWHVSQKYMQVHVYFNYYQLFSITLNHFLFGKAHYFVYFPQEKFTFP